MKIIPFENKFFVEIRGIDNIEYIDVLDIYLDSFFRMTQNPEMIHISMNSIKKLCTQQNKKTQEEEPIAKYNNVIVPVLVERIQPVQFNRIVQEEEDEDEVEGILFEEEEYDEEEAPAAEAAAAAFAGSEAAAAAAAGFQVPAWQPGQL